MWGRGRRGSSAPPLKPDDRGSAVTAGRSGGTTPDGSGRVDSRPPRGELSAAPVRSSALDAAPTPTVRTAGAGGQPGRRLLPELTVGQKAAGTAGAAVALLAASFGWDLSVPDGEQPGLELAGAMLLLTAVVTLGLA